MKIEQNRFPTWLEHLDPNERLCNSCDAKIVWGKTRNGKRVPIDVPEDGEEIASGIYVSHFSTCPDADKHRK